MISIGLYSILYGITGALLATRAGRSLHLVQAHDGAIRRFLRRALGVLLAFEWTSWSLFSFGFREPVGRALRTGLQATLRVGSATLSISGVLTFVVVLVGTFLAAAAVKLRPRGRGPSAIPALARPSLHDRDDDAIRDPRRRHLPRAERRGRQPVALHPARRRARRRPRLRASKHRVQLRRGAHPPLRAGRFRSATSSTWARSSAPSTASGCDRPRCARVRAPKSSCPTATSSRRASSTGHSRTARRRVQVRVGVAYGTDPEKVIALLLEAASDHPEALADPAPAAFFVGFGDSSLDFVLHDLGGSVRADGRAPERRAARHQSCLHRGGDRDSVPAARREPEAAAAVPCAGSRFSASSERERLADRSSGRRLDPQRARLAGLGLLEEVRADRARPGARAPRPPDPRECRARRFRPETFESRENGRAHLGRRLAAGGEIHHRVERLALRHAAQRREARRGVGAARPTSTATSRPSAASSVSASGPDASVSRAARSGSSSGSTIERRERARRRQRGEGRLPPRRRTARGSPACPRARGHEGREDPVGNVEVLGLERREQEIQRLLLLRRRHPRDGRLPVSGDGVRLELAADELLRGLDAEAVVEVGEIEALLQRRTPTRRASSCPAPNRSRITRRTACVVASQRTGSAPQSYSAQRGSLVERIDDPLRVALAHDRVERAPDPPPACTPTGSPAGRRSRCPSDRRRRDRAGRPCDWMFGAR